MFLAGDGNYFETRRTFLSAVESIYRRVKLNHLSDFTPWMKPREYEEYHLPRRIQKLQGATHVTFGDAVISTPDTCIGVETCVRSSLQSCDPR
jgi:hypothetical protein